MAQECDVFTLGLLCIDSGIRVPCRFDMARGRWPRIQMRGHLYYQSQVTHAMSNLPTGESAGGGFLHEVRDKAEAGVFELWRGFAGRCALLHELWPARICQHPRR